MMERRRIDQFELRNLSFEVSEKNLNARFSNETTSTHIWRSHRLTEVGQGGRQSYFTDAQIQEYGRVDNTHANQSRYVTISEFDHSNDHVPTKRLEDVEYSQSSSVGLQSTATTRSSTVSGNYTSRLTNNYQVTVATESEFRIVSGGLPSFQEAASGSFLMYSENGDKLVISVLPLPPIDGY